MFDVAAACQPHRRLIQEGVQEQRLQPESGQSERPESRGRQQRLIAMSPNEEAAVQETAPKAREWTVRAAGVKRVTTMVDCNVAEQRGHQSAPPRHGA